MKRFNLLYYLFIFASMLLSVIMAPAMFIQQNVLAGWLWIGVFLLFLLLLLYGATKETDGAMQYETQLGTIIAWVCIIGQWIIIFIHPNNGLYYNFGLMMIALGSIYIGWWGARLHLSKTTTNPPTTDIHIGISVDEARRKHFER